MTWVYFSYLGRRRTSATKDVRLLDLLQGRSGGTEVPESLARCGESGALGEHTGGEPGRGLDGHYDGMYWRMKGRELKRETRSNTTPDWMKRSEEKKKNDPRRSRKTGHSASNRLFHPLNRGCWRDYVTSHDVVTNQGWPTGQFLFCIHNVHRRFIIHSKAESRHTSNLLLRPFPKSFAHVRIVSILTGPLPAHRNIVGPVDQTLPRDAGGKELVEGPRAYAS